MEQYVVYNQLLNSRSTVIPIDVSRPSTKMKFKVKFNGKPVNSYLYSSFECTGIKVTEKAHLPQLFIELPKIEPLSVNLLAIESIYDYK